ncbi:hypothetical protein, partial [Leptospira santarosai]|uniref:hypothetical protein n=1 Tax=Leptospira santarosai TaxID=28183 RepID=UPI0006ACA653
HQGEENKERVEKLLKESQELANRDISGGLLDGLQEMIASIQGSLPQEVSANGVSQYIQAQEKELQEKQSKVNELLSHMNSLVTNNNDLAALQTLLQGSNQGLNFAANSAVSKYLDDYAKKLQKDNEERSTNLQKTLLEALTNGDQYKYLREAGYGFRTDGEGISAYRQIHSGEIAIDGSAMKETSYSPELEYQYIRMETKFNPGNLSVDMMDPNNTRFNAEMVLGLKGYIDDLQKNVEEMFAQFSNKTEEIQEEYAQNQEIESYQKKLYEASKENYVAAFQVLPGDLGKTFQQEMNGLKGYHEQGSKYNFNEGSFKDQSGDMKKVGKSMYDGANIEDTVFAGSRELKGSVSVKGIPVEISYGMQHLLVTSGFNISNLGFNFKLKGVGTNYVDNQLSGANQKYSIYSEDISARIERQAKVNDEEKESKGFLFTILNGMNGGSGSMGQRFTQAVRSEAQSRITGAVAEATGLPASLVGALVGGSSMKDAVKAYVKDETTNAISKATGIPAWMISNQMEKMNKPKEQWYQSQTFQMVTTVVAVAAAPFTGGASLLVAMSVSAGLGAVTGAASGGLKGALVGAVGGAAGAAVKSFTGGAVTVGLSYSAENGFGASVGVGYGPAAVTVGVSERGGVDVGLGFQYGLSNNNGALNGGLNYNSKTGKASGNLGFSSAGGSTFAMSYNEQSGAGVSAGHNFESGVGGNVSWSEHDGFGGGLSYSLQQNEAKTNKWAGAGANLSFSQRGPTSVNITAGAGQKENGEGRTPVAGTNPVTQYGSGGATAGTWTQGKGFEANTNFLMDRWAQDYLSDYDDARQERERQQQNNQHQGADAIAGYGVRRDEEFNFTADGEAESSDNIGGDNGKGKKPTLNEVEAMMNRYNSFQEGLDSIRNTKTTHYDTANQEGSNIVRSVKTESGENGKTNITIDRSKNVGFDAETTPFFSRDSKGNLVPVTDAHVSSPFTGYRDVTNSAHNGIDVISHAFRASADLEVTGITHGASRNVGGDPTKPAGIWMQGDKLMTYSTVNEKGEAFRDKSGRPEARAIEYTAALAARNNISAQDHAVLVNHASSNPNQYHGNGNSVTGRYTMGDGTKVDLIYKHAPSLEGLQNGKPVIWASGNKINQGDMVLTVGSTGRSTGPHAHFEVQSRSTFGLDLNKNADVIRENPKNPGHYVIDGRYFTNNILKKDLENR